MNGRIVARSLVKTFHDGDRATEVLRGVDLEVEPVLSSGILKAKRFTEARLQIGAQAANGNH